MRIFRKWSAKGSDPLALHFLSVHPSLQFCKVFFVFCKLKLWIVNVKSVYNKFVNKRMRKMKGRK